MNTTKFDSIHFFWISIIMLSSVGALALDNSNRKDLIGLTFSNTKIEDDNVFDDKLVNVQLEYSHKIIKNSSIGVYFGYGIYNEWLNSTSIDGASFYAKRLAQSFQYGFVCKLYLLPFIFEDPIPRLDLYVLSKAGVLKMNSSRWAQFLPAYGNYLNYSLMGGLTFYLSKKFGITAEAGYTYFKYRNGFNARYGIAYRF